MIHDEALNHLRDGEGLTIEYKKAQKSVPKDVYETIVAFSNRNGGYIYLGVQDDGTILGVEEKYIAAMKNDFSTSVNNVNKIYPPLYLGLEELMINGKIVLYTYVPISSQVHRLNQHKIMDRNKTDGDIEITNNTHAVQDMFMRKDSAYTENRIYPFLTLSDFKIELIELVKKRAVLGRDDHPFADMTDFEIMKSLGMYRQDLSSREEGFTLAAVLCFGKNETIAGIVNYWRIDVLERIQDRERYDNRLNLQTNLIDTYYAIMEFLEKQVSLPDKFLLDGTTRVSGRNILFRELVINMLIHREYSNAFVSTISIYSEKIEVRNANKPVNPGLITQPIISPFPKNPTIAKVFNYLGVIDELGSGISKIFKFSKLYFGTAPIIENEGLFTVILNRQVPFVPQANPQPIVVNESGNAREEQLIHYLYTHQKITNKEIVNLLQVSSSTARRLAQSMVKRQLIIWIGNSKNDPNQYYQLPNEAVTE